MTVKRRKHNMSLNQKLNVNDWRDSDKIKIMPFGDNHFGSKSHNLDRFKLDLERVLDTPDMYALFMGDNIDCGTRDSVGAGVYEQSDIIDRQMQDWVQLVKPLADAGKVIGTHTGNHEWRIYKSSGIDVARIMAKDAGIKYFGWSIFHYWMVGDQRYTAFSTHGSGGSRLPHTKIKAVLDRQNMGEADLYLMGHLHSLSHHTRQFYTVDKRQRRVTEDEKHFVLCGSYLNHWGSYGEQAGYEMLKVGSPTVRLDGLEKKIHVSV